jgi:hypothetical protein
LKKVPDRVPKQVSRPQFLVGAFLLLFVNNSSLGTH